MTDNGGMDEQFEEMKRRAESYRRDPEKSRHLNSRMVPALLQRIAAGKDSIEAVRQRVKAISENPQSEPHTIWNAQNFLEQVEAALEAKDG